jgi:hypothetical protein
MTAVTITVRVNFLFEHGVRTAMSLAKMESRTVSVAGIDQNQSSFRTVIILRKNR